MDAMFLAGNSFSNEDYILEKLAQIFIEIISVSNYYDYISGYVAKIAEFTFYLVSQII